MLAVSFMAFDTFGFSMLSEKGEIRKVVVEGAFVEMNDIGVAAFMVGVTGCAAGVARFGRQAVKPRACIYVGGDVFMTVETQCALFRSLEFRVARIAVFFVLGVTFDDLAGHDQCLDLGIGSFGYHAG